MHSGEPTDHDLVRRRRLDTLVAWAVARTVVALGFGLAWGVERWRPSWVRDGRLGEGLMAWDAGFYHQIASNGYGPRGSEDLRFFPGYPLLGRAVSWMAFGNVTIALLVVANVAAFVAMLWLRVLVADVTGDEALARRAVWWLALFPAAAVLVFGYSEALALAATIGAVLAARRRRWELAVAAGFVAGVARPLGVIVALPVLVSLWPVDSDGDRGRKFRALLAAAAPVVGVGVYLGWVQLSRSDGLFPLRIQSELRAGAHEPVTRLVRGVAEVVTGDRRDVFNIAFALALVVALWFAARALPWTYSVYAGITLLLGLAANNIDSLGRYGLAAFPFAIGFALAARRWRIVTPALIVSAVVMAGFTVQILVRGVVP